MAIPKYKDPITGKWNRITTYGQSGNPVEITKISGETTLSDDIITELKNNLNWISYGGGAYRFVSAEEDKRLYSYITEDKISQILVNTLTKTCALRETQITAASVADSIVKRDSYGEIPVSTPSRDSSATNKAYVDEADKNLRLKLSNLEQALNGYILDTTKEAYADLDSAVLKNNVAVGDNVYPIADKTRAFVSRIEGKTTKMVQLLDKSTFPATTTTTGITFTNNGDGSITVDGTATATTNLVIGNVALEANHKYLLKDEAGQNCPTYQSWVKEPNGTILLQTTSDNKYTIATCSADENVTVYIRVEKGATVNNVKFFPQLFDLTAMNREDITTAEQFKAEFPELYPYENGNIYPAKISGVKFYENQDKSGEQASVTLPETYSLHGIGGYKDYLEITKNKDNELYTLKRVQVINKHVFDGTEAWSVNTSVENNYQVKITGILWGPKINLIVSSHYPTNKSENSDYSNLDYAIMAVDGDRIRIKDVSFAETGLDGFKAYLAAQFTTGTPVTAYYALAMPVETVIATNFTYEQVTAVRHSGGLIEVEGNVNKGYARPTVKNTVVYRLTATSTAEG